MPSSTQHEKSALRAQIRNRRNQLCDRDNQQAARQLALRVSKLPLFRKANHIAGYVAANGELNPQPLLRLAHRLGKKVYLPVLDSMPANKRLRFVRFIPGGTPMKPNRYAILEPSGSRAAAVDPAQLDLVLMPLVAFDRHRRRLGMGGGFYDHTFAFKRKLRASAKPVLLGIAHSVQQVERVPTNIWDVSLKGIATDRAMFF